MTKPLERFYKLYEEGRKKNGAPQSYIDYFKASKFLLDEISAAKKEEHQFFLNILNGIDIADREMGNTGGGTKAIRFALKSRLIE